LRHPNAAVVDRRTTDSIPLYRSIKSIKTGKASTIQIAPPAEPRAHHISNNVNRQSSSSHTIASTIASTTMSTTTTTTATSGLALDAGAWPIVHGSPESLDYTALPTPTTAALHFYNTQGLSPSSEEGLDDEAALLAAAQRAFLAVVQPQQQSSSIDRPQKSFSMADANPVSIITERVSDTEQRL
jgi:hypothetical protein